MPFTGSSNLVKPVDAIALMNSLTAQREQQQRLAMEQQQQQAEQARLAKQDKRDELLFRADLALKLKDLEPRVDSSRRGLENASRNVTPQTFSREDLFGDLSPEEGMEFAELAGSLSPSRNIPQDIQNSDQYDAALATFQGDAQLATDMFGQINPNFSSDQAFLATMGAADRVENERVREVRFDDEKRRKQLAKEKEAAAFSSRLAEAKERRLAIEADRRAVSRIGREISTLDDQIQEQRRIAATAPLGSEARATADRKAARIEAALTKKLTEGVDPGHFANMREWENQEIGTVQEAATAIQDVQGLLQVAESSPQFLGTTRGGLTEFMNFALESAQDIGATTGSDIPGGLANMFASVINLVRGDSSLSDSDRERVLADLGVSTGLGDDQTLQTRNDAKALASRMAYVVTKGNNPGRFSITEYQRNLALFDPTNGSAAGALRRLKTGLSEMEGVLQRSQSRVSTYRRLQIGPQGSLVSPETGETVFPPTPPTNFRSQPQQQLGPVRSSVPPRTGPSAAGYMELSPEEKAAYLEREISKGLRGK